MTVAAFLLGAKHALEVWLSVSCVAACHVAQMLASKPLVTATVCPAGRIPVALAYARATGLLLGCVPTSLSRARVNPWLNKRICPIKF